MDDCHLSNIAKLKKKNKVVLTHNQDFPTFSQLQVNNVLAMQFVDVIT
jgi:hypothetical protein